MKYILTPEGMILNTGNDDNPVWEWEYYLKDHLGNVRVVIEPTAEAGKAAVQQENHYYPFGMLMSQLSSSASSTNDYLFSGKQLERSFDLGWYDFGGRANFNSQLGVWHSIDRFAEKYYNLTSYQYAANNPMRYIDVNGDSIWVNGYYYGYTAQYGYGFYDKSGALYTGDDQFLTAVNRALAEMSLGEEGKGLVTELSSSSNRFDIKSYTDPSNITSSDNFFTASDPSAAYSLQITNDPSLSNFRTSSGGSGGTIYWNTSGSNTGGVWVLGGRKDNNATLNLAHEMYHGRDANRGLLFDDQYTSGNWNGLSKSEWQATYKENLLRREMGHPLREYYFSTRDPYGYLVPYVPRLLDSKNNTIRPFWMSSSW